MDRRGVIELMLAIRSNYRPYVIMVGGAAIALLSHPRGRNIIVRRTDGRAKRNSEKNVTTKRVVLLPSYLTRVSLRVQSSNMFLKRKHVDFQVGIDAPLFKSSYVRC